MTATMSSAVLARRLRGLSPAKRALLEDQLRAQGVDLDWLEIPPVPRDRERYPLSFQQERMWFLHRFAPDNPNYHVGLPMRILGAVDPRALDAAVGGLIERHEALRTSFGEEAGVPFQRLRSADPGGLPWVDLTGLAADDAEASSERLAARALRRPFDFSEALLRLVLVRLGRREHGFLLILHHIVSDGWSLTLFFRELLELYQAARERRRAALDPPALQYPDYAVWQRRWMEGDVYRRQLDYWRECLEGAPTALDLPLDRPRPRVLSFRGGGESVPLGPEESERLRAFCRQEKVTPFAVLLALWSVLLGRLAGQRDVLVGTPVAGRHRKELEGIFGFFVNTLVLRTEWSEETSVRELVGLARRRIAEAQDHQDLPFERLVDVLSAERDLERTPLFQASFSYQWEVGETLEAPGMRLLPQAAGESTSRFELALAFEEGARGLSGALVYSADLFDHTSARRLARRLRRLLDAALEEPERRVASLPQMGAAEVHQLLREWHAEADAGPAGPGAFRFTHEIFEAVAERMGEAPALVFEGEETSYAALDLRANLLARRLRAAGAGPERLVGILLPRGPEVVAAILAVLKSGAGYLPLDVDTPDERLATMLEDAREEGFGCLVVTDAEHRGRLPVGSAAVVFEEILEEDFVEDVVASEERAAPPSPTLRPDNAAYAIFTSGSTGRPKGVLIPHGALANRLEWSLRHDLSGGSRRLFKTTVGFDVSALEIFMPLLDGGLCVIARQGGQADPAYLLSLMAEHRVDQASFAPSAIDVLIERPELASCRDLDLLYTAAEAVPEGLPARVHERLCVELLNRYGPTEATIGTLSWRCAPSAPPGPVPIGRPISGAEIFVLDRRGRLVPAPVAGELHIGGECLARGYLRRPSLTAERFVPHGFGDAAGARLYRTGDLVRFRAAGVVDFLGRIDHQVKVRGFRVEPGEIESALKGHPALAEVAVIDRRDASGVVRLVAYPVFRNGEGPSAEELRAFLEERLPAYMIPSFFLPLPALPRLANGKLDRKGLPFDPAQVESSAPFTAPETEEEKGLAAIWQEVLGVKRVGTGDVFFELGGHSLLLMRVVSRIRDRFGVEPGLRDLFEQPTLGGQAARVAAARRAGSEAGAPPPLVRREGDRTSAPLSFAQQRLWFLHQLEPESPAYNLPLALDAEGELSCRALGCTLRALAERHETLRTAFPAVGGEPVQAIGPAAGVPLPVLDLRGLAEAEREAEAQRLAGRDARRPFDLGAGPLLRCTLLRLARDRHRILFGLHHIVTDGWSRSVLGREVGFLYRAFAEGTSPSLEPLAVQYADYAVWQRSRLAGERLEAELAFWRRRLEGAPPALELPTDRPREARPAGRGGSRILLLPDALVRRLEALGRAEGATLFMVLLAAFQLLLGRWAGQRDVSVGVPSAGRSRRELEGLIGFFINTLVLRTDLGGDPCFRELLGRVRSGALEAQEHQEIPFEKLVEELSPERSLTHTPLFQVLFALQNTPPTEPLELPGLRLEPVGGGAQVTELDWNVEATPVSSGLALSIQYRADLFEATTIERALRQARSLLEGIAETPESRLSGLSLLSRTARHQALVEWNDTASDAAGEATLWDLFAASARARPEAPAVAAAGIELSYREVEAAAAALAARLRAHGCGTETMVAVCAPRGPALAVGVLGALRAGAAFLPLDPAYPRERIELMLSDSGARVLVAGDGAVPEVSGGAFARLDLDARGRLAGHSSDETALAALKPSAVAAGATAPAESAAYAVYTSGSTGRPKGVVVPHRAAAAYCRAMVARWGLGSDDRFLQFASPGFDVLIEELFPVWSAGGTVVFRDEETLLDTAGLGRTLEEEGITAVELPAAYWHEWVEALDRLGERPAASLRRILVGCEKPSSEDLRRWAAFGVPLFYVFGLTETTVTNAQHRVAAGAAAAGDLPIGRPDRDNRLYALDAQGAPVPPGLVGELAVGGPLVARGYRGRPAETARRFVPDPFGGERGGRLYRTGDRARYRPTGEIDFLGREDDQVKIRGFRVEPGEVRAALLAEPGVEEAWVLALADDRGGKRLGAYLVVAGGLDEDALRAGLSRRLPEHMVPSGFVELDQLPRTLSGKVDVRRLEELMPAARPAESSGTAPRTPTEELLAGLWADALGLERVGAESDFFALGGHSLLATRLISRARQAFGIEIPLRDLFEGPTPAALAPRVEAALRAGSALPRPPLEPASREGDLPLSFAQQRLWFLDRLEPGSAAYNLPLPVRAEGPLVLAALERAFAGLVARHETLRTVFAERRGVPVQIVRPAAAAPLPVIDLAGLGAPARAARVGWILGREASRPFDLAVGPLLRASVLRLAPEDHVVQLTLHHVVGDEWSMGVLVRDLDALYAAALAGQEASLPPLPLQYADFAVWQRGWLRDQALEEQLAFWRRYLEGAPPLLELPLDRPRPAEPSSAGAAVDLALPDALSGALLRLGREHGATAFMTLLALFQALVGRHAGSDDVCVGTPVAGRGRLETENLIGFFVNTLVLRARLGEAPSFGDLVERVRGDFLDAWSHQDLPFERLVEDLQPERDAGRSPIFQVVFALESAAAGTRPQGPHAGTPTRLSPLAAPVETAKFDLGLVLTDSPGGFAGRMVYKTALFDATTVRRLGGQLVRLAEAVAADPHRQLGAQPLLGAAEAHQIRVEWNDTATAYPRDLGLPEVFAAAARRDPGATAVVCGADTLSYGELERLSNQVARALLAHGVVPGERVGVALSRTPAMVVTLLGILKAGAAYVPLDLAYPEERLRFLLGDARVRLLVTEESLASTFENAGPRTVLLDRSWQRVLELEDSPLEPRSGPDSLAYVMYTSGSTGRPKGVAVTHRNVTRLVLRADFADLGPDQVFLQLAPTSFDAATLEIWAPLSNGGRLVLYPGEGASLEELAAVVDEQGVTALWLTAGLFHRMAEGPLERLAGLRQLLAGGDVLSPSHVRRALGALPGLTLINGYGPTENTTFTCCWPMTSPEAVGETVSIGRPIADTRVLVLDRSFRPCPLGVAGELWAGGDGMARGYLDRPRLTAERFVPDPGGGGERLYRTGDQARWRPDGTLDFLGRRDHQLKLRGFRIEPGEVEAALAEHPRVRTAVVVPREDVPGDRRLVAYLVTEEPGEPLGVAALREHAAARLPAYMVPSAFVQLDALPLTANGKLDRAALPAPDGARPELEGAYAAPETGTETTLAAIWAEVLGVDRVGLHDGFFDLGGHSLLAVQVLSRVREEFGVELPLRTLFDSPTVAGMAAAVDGAETGQDQARLEELLSRIEAMGAESAAAELARIEAGDDEA